MYYRYRVNYAGEYLTTCPHKPLKIGTIGCINCEHYKGNRKSVERGIVKREVKCEWRKNNV